jgi:hypothetical protein
VRSDVPYPGVLMTEEQHQLFDAEVHCPTAVRVTNLDYVNERNFLQHVILLGDPTQFGPNINDKKGLSWGDREGPYLLVWAAAHSNARRQLTAWLAYPVQLFL